MAGRQDPNRRPVSCSACVREAAALHRVEAPLQVSLAEGSPEARLTDVWGCPAPTQEEAVGGGGCLQAMPAQVLTPPVPSLCAPQGQIPDLSLHRDGGGGWQAGHPQSRVEPLPANTHPQSSSPVLAGGSWPQDCPPRTFASPQPRFTVQSNQLHPEGEPEIARERRCLLMRS